MEEEVDQPRESTNDTSKVTWSQFVDVAQIVTAAAAVIGIFFTGAQLWALSKAFDRSDRQNNISAWSSISQQEFTVDQLFIDRPDLKKYIYDGVAVSKGSADYDKTWSVAAMVIDFFENVEDMAVYLPPDRTTMPYLSISSPKSGMIDRPTWEHYMIGTFHTSPIMCDIIRERGADYDSALNDLARKGCKKL